jgi:hypothetical protein
LKFETFTSVTPAVPDEPLLAPLLAPLLELVEPLAPLLVEPLAPLLELVEPLSVVDELHATSAATPTTRARTRGKDRDEAMRNLRLQL